MNDRECNETYRLLVDILTQRGLDWVVEQVEEQIRLGKTLEKEVDTLQVSRKRFSEQPSLFTVEGYAERNDYCKEFAEKHGISPERISDLDVEAV